MENKLLCRIWSDLLILEVFSILLLLLPSALLDIKQKKIWLPWLGAFFVESVVLLLIGVSNWNIFVFGMLPGVVLIVVSIVTRGEIGLGDGYLVCVLGSLVGLKDIVNILTWAILLLAVTGIFLVVVKHWGRKSTLPFVPFLLVAYIMQVFIM